MASILEKAAKLAENVIASLNWTGDEQPANWCTAKLLFPPAGQTLVMNWTKLLGTVCLRLRMMAAWPCRFGNVEGVSDSVASA